MKINHKLHYLRNSILQKWYEKTSVFISKNNIGLEKPIMQQLENVC